MYDRTVANAMRKASASLFQEHSKSCPISTPKPAQESSSVSFLLPEAQLCILVKVYHTVLVHFYTIAIAM